MSPALGAPGAYESWVGWLDAYACGEDLPSRHLGPIDERMGPHMQERLVRRIAAAFETRAQRWADTLTRHLGSSTVRQPAELAAALIAARGRLRPLQTLASDSRLPEAVRTSMTAAMTQMVHEAQDSLERSARRQLGSSQQLLAVLRQNSLIAASPLVPPTPSPVPSSARGRRVIL